VSVALRGSLKDFGIAEVFQLIGQQRKTGVLELTGAGQRIELRFDQGAVVSAAPLGSRPHAALGEMLVRCGLLTRERLDQLHRDCESSAQGLAKLATTRGWIDEESLAELDELLTRETIFAIMGWTVGSFDFTPSPIEHERPLETLLGAEQILMDGLRMVDEWHSFAELVPSEDLVFQRVGSFDAYRDRARDEVRRRLDAAERVFFLIDGRLDVRRVIDLSRLGTFDATRILADLRRTGVIEPVARSSARPARRLPGGVRLDAALLREGLAAAVPILLLSLIAAAALRGPVIRVQHGTALERSALAEAAASFAARRVRHALEAHLMMVGEWPQDLAALRERELLDNQALALAAGRPYHYERREDGVLLLAPER
jgi:hypothetical protein